MVGTLNFHDLVLGKEKLLALEMDDIPINTKEKESARPPRFSGGFRLTFHDKLKPILPGV